MFRDESPGLGASVQQGDQRTEVLAGLDSSLERQEADVVARVEGAVGQRLDFEDAYVSQSKTFKGRAPGG